MGTQVRGLTGPPSLRADIARRMSDVLRRRQLRPIGVRVSLSDEDGRRAGWASAVR
jgi:hypothetical protein